MPSYFVLVICVLSFPLLGSCGLVQERCDPDKAIDPSPVVKRANEQERLWESSKPQAYTMLIDRGCFCNPQWWVTSVEGDESSSFLLTDRTLDPDTEFSSMHDVFEHIRTMANSKPASMDVSYSDAHFPESFGANSSECITDRGVGYGLELVNVEERMGTAGALECADITEQLPGVWLLRNNDQASPVTATIEATPAKTGFFFTERSSSGERTLSFSVFTNKHGKFCPILFDKTPLPTESTALLLTANFKELRMESMDGQRAYYRRMTESVAP